MARSGGTKNDAAIRKELEAKNLQLEEVKHAMLNVLEDLEEEKAKIEKEQLQTQALVESIGEGVAAINANGEVVFLNREAERILHVRIADVLGRQCMLLGDIEDEHRRAFSEDAHPLLVTLRTGRKYSGLQAYLAGTPVTLTVSPAYQGEKLLGAVAVFRDITKELKLEEMRANVAAVAMHQLRSPLTDIRWFAEMLLDADTGPLNQDQQAFAQQIHQGILRMSETVNALLALSKLEEGVAVEDPRQLRLTDVTEEALKLLQREIAEKQLKVIVKTDQDLPEIIAEPSLLRQVVGNLLSNAVRYSHPGKRILVTMTHDRDMLRWSVKDHGIGVPKAEQEKLFTKFYRAENARKMVASGTGLGLILVKAIVEMWLGNVWFRSREGKGSEFFFTVPIHAVRTCQLLSPGATSAQCEALMTH